MPNTLDVALNFSGQHSMPISEVGGTIIVRVDYQYQDHLFFEPSNNPFLAQEGYGTVNAKLTYELPFEKRSVALIGRNLTNEVATANGFISGGGGIGATTSIAPRMWGISHIFKAPVTRHPVS